MSATWALVNEGEYRGCGYWTCPDCGAELTAQRLPAVLRRAAPHGAAPLLRPLCAHCAERPPAAGEVEVVMRGRVVAWEP